MKLAIELPGSPAFTSQLFVARNTAADFTGALASCLKDRRPFWIWDKNVFELWYKRLEGTSWPEMEDGRLILFPASERNKRLSAVESLATQLLALGADRGSTLLAVGGGVTGDVVGFLASIYLRGVPHIQVPTTLLAQVDSSVGGKTGVDLEEGKNLLGSFHQPQLIWIDLQFLETLPSEEFRQGMAEVIKTAMLGDIALWKYLEDNTEGIQRRDGKALYELVTACCRLKAKVVRLDEKEAGHRRTLNLGHTVGHAIERLSRYEIRHGDAVAMGLVAATKLAAFLGKIDSDVLVRLERLCLAWDLPVRIPARFPPQALLAAMGTDKKRIRGRLHFVLPVGIGEVVDYEDLSIAQLEEILGLLQEDERKG